MKENEIETKSSAVLHGGIPVTDPNYWDCECKENYIHHKSARKECPKCGTYHEDQPDSRVSEVEEGSNIGTNVIEVKIYWKAVAPMLIKALQDPTKSEKDIEWAKSEITKMAEWIDKTQPELEKLSKVEERVETNTILDWTTADAGAEFATIYDFIKGGVAEMLGNSITHNATHTDIQMSLRYDEGDEEYHVDARFDKVRTRDNEPMGEEYQFGRALDTYAEALDAYYKRGHEYEKDIAEGILNAKQVLWSNEVEEELKGMTKWLAEHELSDTDKLIRRHLG